MKTLKLADSGWHECDNCSEVWHADALLDIDGYAFQRVDVGGTVPSGECPDEYCGALCYPAKLKKVKKGVKIGLGYCQEKTKGMVHGVFQMTSEKTNCSLCNEEGCTL